MSEWQPIETALKDGRPFLCWVGATRYSERDDGSVDMWDVSEADFGRWREMDTGGFYENMQGDIGDVQEIAHWMPLPEPPK